MVTVKSGNIGESVEMARGEIHYVSLRNRFFILEERSWQHVILGWKIKSEININLMNLWRIHKSLIIF